jgi:hypothetical protein
MSETKVNKTSKKGGKTTPAGNPQNKGGRNVHPNKGGGKGSPQIPHYLKLSPIYLKWKTEANSLGEMLRPYGMSISELGKGIAEYSARNCDFATAKDLLEAYSRFEAAQIAWNNFRDGFRAQMDSTSVPTGLADKLLSAKTEQS